MQKPCTLGESGDPQFAFHKHTLACRLIITWTFIISYELP